MHDDSALVEKRIERVLLERIQPAIYDVVGSLDVRAWRAPGEPVPFAEAAVEGFSEFELGSAWGAAWSTWWFELSGNLPNVGEDDRLELLVDLGFNVDWPGNQCEGMVYLADGTPLKAVNSMNRTVLVKDSHQSDSRAHYLIEAAGNPDILAPGFRPTQEGDRLTSSTSPLYTFRSCDFVVRNEDVWHLFHDVTVLRELMLELPAASTRRAEILRSLEDCMDAIDPGNVSDTAAAGRAAVADVLASPANASALVFTAVGHAHIDSAWLWPVRETIRKSARTWANVTALAEEYPDFLFAATSAQQYQWVQDSQPVVWDRLQKAIADDQWAVVGGMWVESDANLPGGEAFVRQFTSGIRYFMDELGVRPRGLWLPDSFGYSGALPQIAALAGMEWFLTQKLSWNQVNTLPHHTFWWEGIDGTRIFTHFPPVDCYDSVLAGDEVHRAERNFAEKGRAKRSLLPFGYGDGGGGPTKEMMERYRRLQNLEGSPRLEIASPNDFFAAALAEYPDAPVYAGELYLELHRATYTSQARTKQGNRRSEHLLRTAELVCTMAAVWRGVEYPADCLDRIWKKVLLLQFHDILPGTSIAWVHREAEADYAGIAAELEEIIGTALHALASTADQPRAVNVAAQIPRTAAIDGPAGSQLVAEIADDSGPLVPLPPETWVLNVAPHRRTAVIEGPIGRQLVAVPASSFGPVTPVLPSNPVHVMRDPEGTPLSLSNGLLTCEFDADGTVSAIYDHQAGRSVIPAGARANLLQMHPDLPNEWDAWDIDAHYRNRRMDLTDHESFTVVCDDGLRGAVRVVRRLGESLITQNVSLEADSRRLDFGFEIDWHEREKIIKAAFPLDVYAAEHSAEVQFGQVRRPIHTNTSWENAQFEVYAHRFIHVAEPGYGVAIANDSTYGHDVTRILTDDGRAATQIRLSLVRAPQSPDPLADKGFHSVRYALVLGGVHGATIDDAAAAGYELNLPLRMIETEPGAPTLTQREPQPFVSVDHPGVHIEAVKLAFDGSGDVVVRLYEGRGGRTVTRLRTAFAFEDCVEVDLLEDPRGTAATQALDRSAEGDLALQVAPFQILTLRFSGVFG